MKTKRMTAVLFLTWMGCTQPGAPMVDQSAVMTVADPSPTPSPSPTPTPTPSPSPSPSPSPTAVQTSSYSTYGCELMSDNSVEWNGVQVSGFTRTGTDGFLSVVAGDGIGCVFEDASGAPTQCADTGCANPPQDADVQCFTEANGMVPVVLNPYAQFGFNPMYYSLGALSMSQTGGTAGQVCITFAIYTTSTSPATWFENMVACGTAVTAQGVLQ